MSLRGVLTTKQSQSEIPRFHSEQGLPRFPFTTFRALAHRNDRGELLNNLYSSPLTGED